jgi:hypothetical protein
MIIAGIKPTPNGGEVIQCTPEQRVKAAVTAAAADYWDNHVTYVSNVNVKELAANMAGDKLKRKYDNNRYVASGTAIVGRRELTTDTLLNPREVDFEIAFNDCLDENGLPDLKLDKVTFTGV